MGRIIRSFDFYKGVPKPVTVGSVIGLPGLGRCLYARKAAGGWVRKHQGFGINADVVKRLKKGEFGEIKMIVFDFVGSPRKSKARYTVTLEDFQDYAIKDNLGNGEQWFLNESFWKKELNVKQPGQKRLNFKIQNPQEQAERMRVARQNLFK